METTGTTANTCTFTGTKSNIPDYTLGSQKEVSGKVDVIRNGKKETEIIKSPSWKLGSTETGVVKDYEITAGKGKVTYLSEADLKQNPVFFKLWKSEGSDEFVKCSGTCNQGPIAARGTFTVKKPVSGTFIKSSFHGPIIKQGYKLRLPHFSRRLSSSFDLKLQATSNGTLGMIHLVKSKIIQKNSSPGETVIIDTNNEFVLYLPDEGDQDPVQNKVKVINGIVEGGTGSTYKFNLEILQNIDPDYSYRFEEEYRSYLFFKGDALGDIWHPVGFDKSSSSVLSYMKCQYTSSVYCGPPEKEEYGHDDLWQFPDYVPVSPSFCASGRLPEWNKNIHDCVGQVIPSIPVKNAAPIIFATEDNVDDLIGIINLPQGTILSTQEKIFRLNHFLGSTVQGTVIFPLNYHFANATGTTHDPKHGVVSWLALWRNNINGGNNPVACTSTAVPVFGCHGMFVGGHVIDGQIAGPVVVGGDLYIFPICSRHNGMDHIHMVAAANLTGVWLTNFML